MSKKLRTSGGDEEMEHNEEVDLRQLAKMMNTVIQNTSSTNSKVDLLHGQFEGVKTQVKSMDGRLQCLEQRVQALENSGRGHDNSNRDRGVPSESGGSTTASSNGHETQTEDQYEPYLLAVRGFQYDGPGKDIVKLLEQFQANLSLERQHMVEEIYAPQWVSLGFLRLKTNCLHKMWAICNAWNKNKEDSDIKALVNGKAKSLSPFKKK